MSRRPLLFVGMAPNSSSNPRRPLDCVSGRVLAGLFGYEEVSDFAEAINILDRYPGRATTPASRRKGDKFPMKKARPRALELVRLFADYRAVVVLGRGPARCFELEWFEWSKILGAQVAAMPHTSGPSRWWRDARNRAQARSFVRQVKRRARLE